MQVYSFILDNYSVLLEGKVKYCVLPKKLSLIWIREGFIKKYLGTFQIGVDNPPPRKIWKISVYLHRGTCKMYLFSTFSWFSEICRGNIFTLKVCLFDINITIMWFWKCSGGHLKPWPDHSWADIFINTQAKSWSLNYSPSAARAIIEGWSFLQGL